MNALSYSLLDTGEVPQVGDFYCIQYSTPHQGMITVSFYKSDESLRGVNIFHDPHRTLSDFLNYLRLKRGKVHPTKQFHHFLEEDRAEEELKEDD